MLQLNSFHLRYSGNLLLRTTNRRERARHPYHTRFSHHKVVGPVAQASSSQNQLQRLDGDDFQDGRRPLAGPPAGAHTERRPGVADSLLQPQVLWVRLLRAPGHSHGTHFAILRRPRSRTGRPGFAARAPQGLPLKLAISI